MRLRALIFTGIFLLATANTPANAAANRGSSTYKATYSLMQQIWNSDPIPFSKTNVRKYGGIQSFCTIFERAAENDSGVVLTKQKRLDFILACVDFLKTK